MSAERIKNIVEAALMVAAKPLDTVYLMSLFQSDQALRVKRSDICAAITELKQDYANRGIELVEIASGFRFQARQDYVPWLQSIVTEQAPKYSRALLETLAIIVYRQPVTRGEIAEIRGVSVCGTVIKTLQKREWIRVVGHRDVPGKPALFATTKTFLDYFNLRQLSDLPALSDINHLDSISPDLFAPFEKEASKHNSAASIETV